MAPVGQLGVRWTIGDVSRFGFEALRLSIHGAWRVFGPEADYVVCVNTIPVGKARAMAGDTPERVAWCDVSGEMPEFIRRYFDERMAEGVGWKFAPLQIFPGRFELALDNDCVLWRAPEAIRQWLESGDNGARVIAQDVRSCFGQFADFCGEAPRNSGIRGLPPVFDLEGALMRILRERPVTLKSEQDEQGLQVAALSHDRDPLIVNIDEVTICSPFPPHLRRLGSCGAHFVGLNAKGAAWELNGRPNVDYIRDHWLRFREELYERVGIAPPSSEIEYGEG